MQKQLYRFLISALVALGVGLGTNYWYEKNRIRAFTPKDSPPVAYARSVSEDVHRRPADRLLWQIIKEGEPIYSGEALRTSERGEMKIEFTGSSQTIALEQETLIVINQDGKNEISLDLIDGSLFVSQAEKSDEQDTKTILSVKSDDQKIGLGTATAQLSKSKNSKLELQVLKGKATVESNGREQEVDSRTLLSKIEILTPATSKPVYFNPENPTPVVFQWKGFPPNVLVSLAIGKNRKTMTEVTSTNDEKQSSFSHKLFPGRYQWQLLAKDSVTAKRIDGVTSAIYRLEVEERFAPAAQYPAKDELIVKTAGVKAEVKFRWTRPEKAKNTSLEVGRDVDMKDIISKKILISESSFKLPLEEGEYFWRISAVYDDDESAVASRPIKFKVSAQIKQEVKPQIFVGWVNPEEKLPQYYLDQPIAKLAWKSDQAAQVKQWRVKISDNETFLTNPNLTEGVEIFSTQEAKFSVPLKKPGRYIASVEALDEKQNVIARVPQALTLQVLPKPLLKSPIFQPEVGDLEADSFGHLSLSWQKIEGAKEYWIVILNSTGKELKKYKFVGTSATLPTLFPIEGNFRVAIYAVDSDNRESEKRQPRPVLVPIVSGTKAPAGLKAKVK